ncbi:2-polyprenyl-6-methoxyphenol hydroxylase-like oxidoreductase [Piedraia hortae CBS 480.64]|uniref:2-polyprenyl-6-methoxyphenol hydroxylase-like oxidoreductase n=1 Tax=Piedraia hortae CBS 480.64 TaxID=1314780 RepID=A0A6A7BZN2_9PEZI|nr:2-polyprenyl-6-methoxyphenol hydroxylase-like oxidoreductase [Piedraia hortae CBS 480.64]
MAPLSVLIVGNGIAGPVLASFLLLNQNQAAHEKPIITLLERSSGLRDQGQNIDIRGSGMAIARKLGMERALRASITNEEGALFVDAQNRVWAREYADKTGRVQTGTSDMEILRGRLSQLCWKRAESVSSAVRKQGGAGIEAIFGDHLASIEQDGEKVTVLFAGSGKTRTFDLVVGADGLMSNTRRLTWGETEDAKNLRKLHMYGGFFSMPRGPTDSLWRRWFHAPGRRGIMLRPHMDPTKITVFMYVINPNDPDLPRVAERGRQEVSAQKSLLASYFCDAGWECPRIIQGMHNADDFYYSPIAQVRMPSWHRGRVAVIGDAGYCPSPITGMGTTLALNGAHILAGALQQHADDIPAALQVYEEKMRPFVEKAQSLPLGGKAVHLINPETAWGIVVMHIIMWIVTSFTPLLNVVLSISGPPANAISVEDYGFEHPGVLEI